MGLNITESEKEVLSRLANGHKRAEIAKELKVSLSTVHNRIYEAQHRSGCRTSHHLVAWFIRDAVVEQFTAAKDSPVESG